jgi:hypothetical protein
MATNAELQAEVERLRTENQVLRERAAKPDTNRRPAPTKPSFGMSEGQRADLELAAQRVDSGEVTEVAVTDPFTSDVTKVTKANAPQFLGPDEKGAATRRTPNEQ